MEALRVALRDGLPTDRTLELDGIRRSLFRFQRPDLRRLDDSNGFFGTVKIDDRRLTDLL
jgi:hypothetical protein